jgi:hypothetical protein
MDELLEPLVSFFCPTSDAASACRDFISNHSQVMPPIGPMFYFLLFPLVFTILFIYILSSTILHGGNLTKGMQMLIGVSVFIFIIISGWYPIMLFLSEVWFILIIVLAGMWYFIGKHRGEGSPKQGKMPGLGGAMSMIMTKKQEHDELKVAEASIDLAENRLDAIRKGTEQRPSDAMQQIEDSLTATTGVINRFLMDPLHASKATHLEKKKNELLREVKNLRKKIV